MSPSDRLHFASERLLALLPLLSGLAFLSFCVACAITQDHSLATVVSEQIAK